MEDFSAQPVPPARWVLGALSGLQAGVFGALAIIIYMGVVSVAEHGFWWEYPNVLATTFYGARSLRSGAGWPTISGIALQVLAGGFAGSIFGAAFAKVQGASRLILLGVIWGISWFYILQTLSRTFARLVPVYAPEMALLGAHTVFGLILGKFAQRGIPSSEAHHAASDRIPPMG